MLDQKLWVFLNFKLSLLSITNMHKKHSFAKKKKNGVIIGNDGL